MPAGRPLKYETAEEMQAGIDAFFADAEAKGDPLTIAGLALTLGMTTHSLRNYEKKDEFFTTVMDAKAKVEADVEKRLLSGQAATGPIFWLKNNAGWKDRTEQELSGPDKGPIQHQDVNRPKLTKEEWLAAHGVGTTAGSTK